MGRFTAHEAARAAETIYKVRNDKNVDKHFDSELMSKIDLSNASRFTGVSGGAFLIKSRTGFGVIAKGSGQFKNEVILIIRGTQASHIPDLLTDIDVGLQISDTGKTIHAGFNKCYQSFATDIRSYIRMSNPSHVHCIGHSLGGALATIAADWISTNKIAPTTLYTFGSPRVGGKQFAERFTRQMNDNRIFRVQHKTDIVPTIPLWPFSHVPVPGTECHIYSPGQMPWITYHDINRYAKSVIDKDWSQLRQRAPQINVGKQVEAWLNSTNSPISFTLHSHFMIRQALQYILKKILYAAGIVLQAGITSGLTCMDQLAMILAKGIKVSKEIFGHVKNLLIRILKALHKTVTIGADMSYSFIRWVLKCLSEAAYQTASMALRLVHDRL